MILAKTICSSDWKARPSHSVSILGRGTPEELTVLMDKDVAEMQEDDRQGDRQMAEEDAAESESKPVYPEYGPDGWTIQNERWEMEREAAKPTGPQRTFAYDYGDGNIASVVYHFVEE